MENNHSMSRVERSRREKVTRYSVRKVSFGAASVAVAAFFMFLGNGAVYAAEPNVTATDSALAATPANNQLDENSGSSEATAPKAQADTTTPTPADASSTSVESATVSKAQADTTTSKPADATPAPVVSSTTSTTEETSEKATPALDKKQLEDYVAEIDAKLASDSYATKTDESVATLKEHLGLAKLALTTAKSQEELTKAYRRLFMTVNSGLRSKPKAQVESPKLDTTEGKATVGKKASNTEKATGTNSIANSGKHDPRNGQALDRNNPFRTDATTTDTDPSANQTYIAPSADASLEELATTLKNLPTIINNNDRIKDGEFNKLGAAENVDKFKVKEISQFGGWKAIDGGKFALARKNDSGVFPKETINSVITDKIYLREQAFDRSSDYILLLAKAITRANYKTETAYNGAVYRHTGEGGSIGRNSSLFKGIEKTFKAYSKDSATDIQVSFKTGYTGDMNGSKGKYEVIVYSITNGVETQIYKADFFPDKTVDNDKMIVTPATDGKGIKETIGVSNSDTTNLNENKVRTGYIGDDKVEEELSKAANRPNGTPGTFTSKGIVLPKGADSYKVQIRATNQDVLGVSYQAWDNKYALPLTGLDFSITQNTNQIAKDLLQKVYDKLEASKPTDSQGKTPSSVEKYENKLKEIKALLDKGTLDTTEVYKSALSEVLLQKKELVDKGALTDAIAKLKKLTEEADPADKTSSSLTAYTNAKEAGKNEITEAQKVIDRDDVTKAEVLEALIAINEKTAALEAAKAALADKVTDDQKTALGKVATELTPLGEADLAGKTPASKKAYEDEVAKINNDLTTAKQTAAAIEADAENKTQAEAALALGKVEELKAKLATAKALLQDKADKGELTTAKTALDGQTKEADPTVGKTTSTKAAYDAAKAEAEKAVTAAQTVIDNENATPKEVADALSTVNTKKAELEKAKAALADKITQDQKDELANADEDLKLADKTGKTNDSIKAYNDEVSKLSADLAAAKQAAKDLLAKGDNAGELEAYRLQSKISKLKFKLATAAKLLKDIDKSAVKKEVEEAAKNATDAIEANVDLTAEQKEAAKAKVAEEVNKSIAAIDDATTEDDVTAAKNAGKLAIAKEGAKAELEAAQAIKEKAIAGNEKLSDDEKQAVKEQVQNVVDEAKKAVDTATEQAAVDSAKTTGKEAIDALNPVGKEKALDEIQKVTEAKLEAIDKNEKLSEKEKIKAKAKVAKAAIAVVEAINEATDQATVDSKVTEGTKAISSVAEVGKDRAKSAIDIALSAKETAIDANDKLSEAEKSTAKSAAKKAAEDAKKAIESVTTQAEVDANVTKGTKAISSVAEVGKDRAKSALDIALSAKETAIDNNDKLSEAEKSAAKAAAKKAADEAKKAIDAATTQAEVDAKVTEGRQSISSVVEVGKDQAKSALDTALSAKETAIDSNAKLSDAEKSAAKSAAKKAADEAKKAIDAATDQAGVDRILRNDIYKDDAAINEVEAFDLSSLLVNGFVSVKQGETLTDQEVLSKVNLPKDVEVIKVEKPTTSALGRLVAKVTLKLSDGSVEEINVPVEVVALQNHGNEGNGANNGATNTEAKVNKAKLEAAIHQLDEFKFDADTAKEANALSADAKKVFANADASQAEVDAMVKRIEDFMAKVASSTDHATPANDQAAQTPAVAPATTQAAANASQEAATNARKAAKELPNTGTADSTVAMVAAAASALLGLGLAGRRRKEDEEA